MNKKSRHLLAAVLIAAMAACAAAPERAAPAACPPVPECAAEVGEITTNGELLKGFVAYRAAFLQCKIYRDALAACLEPPHE